MSSHPKSLHPSISLVISPQRFKQLYNYEITRFLWDKRFLSANNVQTAFKPHQTFSLVFQKPKDRPPKVSPRNRLHGKVLGLHFYSHQGKQV